MKILDIDVMLLMIFTYGIGIVPALISGLLHQVPIHLMSSRFPRLIASAPIGAAATLTLISDSTKYLVGLFDHSIAYAAVFGAFISFPCAGMIEMIMPPASEDVRP